jgi:hypothetical protein
MKINSSNNINIVILMRTFRLEGTETNLVLKVSGRGWGRGREEGRVYGSFRYADVFVTSRVK